MNMLYRAGVMAVLLFAGCTTGHRNEAHTSEVEPGYKTPGLIAFEDLTWTEDPVGSGMLIATLTGDPKTGAYTQMRVVPADMDFPVQSYRREVTIVIIRGVWYAGIDEDVAKDYGPGSVVTMPAGWAHVSGCRAGKDCLIYQRGNGPDDLNPVALDP